MVHSPSASFLPWLLGGNRARELGVDPLDEPQRGSAEVLADAGLHGADVVAGQEVPVCALSASAVAGGLAELLLPGQVAVPAGAPGAVLAPVRAAAGGRPA